MLVATFIGKTEVRRYHIFALKKFVGFDCSESTMFAIITKKIFKNLFSFILAELIEALMTLAT